MPSHVPPASLATNDPMRLLEGRFDLDHHTGGLRGLGAVLPNVDLREDFNEEDISILKRASNDAGGIIVFPDQSKLSLQDHVAFGRKLGEIEPHAGIREGVAGVDSLNDAHVGRKVWGEQLRFNGLIGLGPASYRSKVISTHNSVGLLGESFTFSGR